MNRRDKRVILNRNTAPTSHITVWVGIYNGSQYIDSLVNQLLKQKCSEFQLLVVDNGSTDDSWEKLQSWLALFEGKITLVKNPINMSFFGSMILNRDLVNSNWILPIHQDDYYFENHITTHLLEIKRAAPDVVGISTDMGSMSNAGKKLLSLPRGSWFPAGVDAPSQFIQNLIAIVVPQPATSFKTKELFDSMGPWHDWSFGDVELTLKMIAKGRFLQVKKQTMRYRENPLSTSHIIEDGERRVGAAIGLTRVFASNEFVLIARQVELEDREAFTVAIKRGIKLRVGDSDFCDFVCLIAMESLAFAWEYESNGSISDINEQYSILNFEHVQKFLGNFMIDNGATEVVSINKKREPSNQSSLKQMLNSKSAIQDLQSSKKKEILKAVIYQVVFRLLPYRVKRYVFEKIAKIAFKVGIKHHWNFTWR